MTGPYTSGSTDVGTGIVYALLFITLLAFAPPARRERLSLDKILVPAWPERPGACWVRRCRPVARQPAR